MPRPSKTGLPPGVSRRRYPLDRPFMAKVKQRGRWRHLGYYATAEEAAKAVGLYKREGVVCLPYVN